jgi:hypothetical protein
MEQVKSALNRNEKLNNTWESFENGFEDQWKRSQVINRRYGDAAPNRNEYLEAQAAAEAQEVKITKAMQEWQKRGTHLEYHKKLTCTEDDHPPVTKTVRITVPAHISKKLMLEPVTNKPMSEEMMKVMLTKTEETQVGGALFQPKNRHYWLGILDYHTRAARWQRLGGVDFLLRRTKQQEAVVPRERPPEEREILAKEIQSLLEKGVYEEVPETEAEEEIFRQYVKSGQWDEEFRKSRLKVKCLNPPGGANRSSTPKHKKSNSLIEFGSDLGMKQKQKRAKREAKKNTKRDQEVGQEEALGLRAQIFYSDLWLKMEGEKARALANLKGSGANKHVRTTTTKQDGVRDLKAIIFVGARFSKWDLRKAFFQVLLQQRLRGMVRTMVQLRRKGVWKWIRLQNTGLSQGLASSPEIITKLFADILRVLRVMGFKCLIKVDDLIAVHPEKIETAMMEAYVITQVLIKLGAVVSGEKCSFPDCLQMTARGSDEADRKHGGSLK